MRVAVDFVAPEESMYALQVDCRMQILACIGAIIIADSSWHEVPLPLGRASAGRRFVGDSRPEF